MPRPALKKRADGRYRVKYKGMEFYGSTSLEAYGKLDAYKDEQARGLRHETAGITVAEYALKWLPAHKSDCTTRTYNGYAAQIDRLNKALGEMRLRDVTQTDIKVLFSSVKGMSKSTVHKFTMIVNGVFRSAFADRAIISNPCADVRPPKADAGTHRAITDDERSLIHDTPHRMRAAAMLMLYAGLRRGEALFFDVDRDYDKKTKTITVRGGVRYDSNKPILATTKTEAGLRVVPIPDILAGILDERHGLIAPAASGSVMSCQAFVRAWDSYITTLSEKVNGCSFRWVGGTKITSKERKDAQKSWKKVSIKPHDLRHSCITMWYNAGVDVLTCSKWAGHSDVTTTMKIYTHLTEAKEESSKMAMIEKVNFLVGGQNGGQNEKTSDEPTEE